MGAFSVSVRDGVAWVELNLVDEPVNKITAAVGQELDALLDRLGTDDTVRAAVLSSGKPRSFIAGADINEFAALKSRDEAYELVRNGQRLINRLEGLDKPVVAAIHGTCLGGGLEAALACAYRIATDDPSTKIGLPEVQIGILPAAGGCQRLPRLIGARAALDIILTGKQLSASRAYRIGIVDELVHPAVLMSVAERAAKRLATDPARKRRWRGILWFALDGNPLGRRLVIKQARAQVMKRTGGHYPAPLAAIDAIEQGLRFGVDAGLDLEAASFAELAVGPVSRQLVNIFFATTALKKDWGVSPPVPEPRHVVNLGIVGAGFMGAAIGGVAVSQASMDVRFRDTTLDQVGKGLRAAKRMLGDRLKRKRISKYEHMKLVQLISGSADWSGYGRVDLVIEAVFEDLKVKHQVMQEIEAVVREDCVIASNTSTLPIAQIGERMQHPQRLIGMHFFSPVERMPLLEVIAAERTASWATVTAVNVGRRMGKTVIVVADKPGFWVNRILAPYLNEAGRLLDEGVSIDTVDSVMVRFGFPVGPITLLDEVGLDVAEKASKVMFAAFGDRMRPVESISKLTSEGRLGRKSGRGFYVYEDGKKGRVDETAYEIIGARPSTNVPKDDVMDRLLFAMLNEATRARGEGVVRHARDGDIGAVFGIGFPPFRGGPLRYLDGLSARHAVESLNELAGKYGERFTPSPILTSMAANNERFYPSD